MRNNLRVLSPIFAFSLLFSGCSVLQQSENQSVSAPVADVSADLFAARGFLGGSDYERYFLKDNVLWRECGNVERSRKKASDTALEGDEVLKKDPTLNLQERRVEKLPSDSLAKVKIAAKELFEAVQKSDSQNVPPPGSAFSLAGKGVLELKLKFGSEERTLLTSVDDVADGEKEVLSAARKFFSLVRGVGPVMCQAETFYGIGR